MPRSQSLSVGDQPSTSARSAEDMRSENRAKRKQKKLSSLGRSQSTPVPLKSMSSDSDVSLCYYFLFNPEQEPGESRAC